MNKPLEEYTIVFILLSIGYYNVLSITFGNKSYAKLIFDSILSKNKSSIILGYM